MINYKHKLKLIKKKMSSVFIAGVTLLVVGGGTKMAIRAYRKIKAG